MADTLMDAVIGFKADTESLKQGLNQAESMIKGAMKRVAKILGPAALAIASKKAFSGYIESADALGKFADSIGENVSKIDAWGLAVRQAGGTAEGFQSSVDALAKGLNQVATTGKGRAKVALDAFGISAKDATGKTKLATDLLMELAGKAESMSKEQFRGLAQTFGIDKGTIMLLQQGKRGVQDLVKEMEGMAITKEDAEIAARFNTEWQNLTVSFQRLTAIIFRAVAPVFTKFTKGFRTFVDYMRKHEFFIKAFLTGIALVITAKVVPAFIAWAAAMLANPITWVVIALALLAVALEDIYVWANGGKSAIKEFLLGLEGGEELVRDIEEALAAIGPIIKDLIPLLKGAFWDYFRDKMHAISLTIKAIADAIRMVSRLIKGDFQGALEAGGNLVSGLAQKFIKYNPAAQLATTIFGDPFKNNAPNPEAAGAALSLGNYAMQTLQTSQAQQGTIINIDGLTVVAPEGTGEALGRTFVNTVERETPRGKVNRVGGGQRF